ncbi:DUF2256 domain-containing protein [Arthrobacter pityocampae]|uniref:DUF2256 domain-containing protein n=1 Tax=Arthrobacter pityocampae TaxID=547334 RepID=UPI00373597E8
MTGRIAVTTDSRAGQDPKYCRSCGRRMEWRKKWERNWDSVLYCSDACRARKVRPIDEALEDWLLTRLRSAPRGQVTDPADAARALGDAGLLHEPARSAARRLVNRGLAEMVQRGAVVDPSTAKGPVGLRSAR